jgi:hypothetical protein
MKYRKFWPLFLFATAVVISTIIFSDVLSYYSVLQAPDAAPSFGITSLLRRMLPWMNGKAAIFTYDDFFKVLPSPAYHEISFIFSTAMLALAMGIYLHTIGLPAIACFAGGLAMAFSGYHFTLFNAGHRGYFIMMPNVIFIFALTERCLLRPRWFHFALIPICALVGISTQPDILAIMVLLIAIYASFRFYQISRLRGFKNHLSGFWKKYLFGVVLTVIVFAVVGHRVVEDAFKVALAGREKQLESFTQASASKSSSEAKGKKSDKSPEEINEEKEFRWIYATNWSLPVAELSELVAPCIRGLDSGNRNFPYWGNIGQSHDWNETREGHFNYRQHTIYLGVVQISFALFALAIGISNLFSRKAMPEPDNNQAKDCTFIYGNGITFFWVAIAAAGVLLALGRFAPFYKLFYALPLMDKVRAPLKFLHITEISISVLFAIGVYNVIKCKPESSAERNEVIAGKATMILLIVAAASCLAASLIFKPENYTAVWNLLGMSGNQAQKSLAKLYTNGFLRSAWLFVLTSTSIGFISFAKPQKRKFTSSVIALLIIVTVILDMGEVASRFVVSEDKAYAHEKSPAMEAITGGSAPDGISFSYLHMTGQPANLPFMGTLTSAGLYCMDPVPNEDPSSWRIQTFIRFNTDEKLVVKLWKLWGNSGIFVPPKMAVAMQQERIGQITGLYDLDPRYRLIAPRNRQQPMVAVVKPFGVIPPVSVYYGWKASGGQADTINIIADSDFEMEKQIAIEGDGISDVAAKKSYTPGQWETAPSETRGHYAVAKVKAEQPGMVLLRENLMRTVKTVVTVNDKKTSVYTANGIWLCVPVDEGESEIIIRPYISMGSIVWHSAAVFFTLLALYSFVRSEYSKSGVGQKSSDTLKL